MKKISIVVPCYNEKDNVGPMCKALTELFAGPLAAYDYEIIFADNYSRDGTREILRGLCAENRKVKAIFNCQNFGQINSPYHAILQSSGDCTVLLAADFQDPVEMIPVFVKEWEQGGYQVVCGVKTASRENKLMYFLRSCYYHAIKRMSSVEQIEHFTGFGLYDRNFVQILRELQDPTPFLRGIVAEYAPNRKEVPFEQPRRRAGKTHNNWYSLYDVAMLSFTSYTKVGLRLATFFGFAIAGIGFVIALVYLIMKLVYWDRFVAGMAPILIGIFVLGGIQIFFIGLLGEYILNMNTRIIRRPLVVEEERLNFE